MRGLLVICGLCILNLFTCFVLPSVPLSTPLSRVESSRIRERIRKRPLTCSIYSNNLEKEKRIANDLITRPSTPPSKTDIDNDEDSTTLERVQAGIDKLGGNDVAAMMGLCFLVAVICALDRVAMSVAIVPMSKEFGYSATIEGLISSSFSWGYMVAMIPAGVLGTFINPKIVMGVGVLLWSLAQTLSPLAAQAGLPVLLGCRFAMGMSEAVTIPTIQEIVSQWIPSDQRTRWLALITSGLQVGTVMAYMASPTIIENYSWEGIFWLYGAAGLVWLSLWFPFAKDSPPKDFGPMDDAIAEPGLAGAMKTLTAVPWKDLVTDPIIWSVAAAHMAHNWGLYVMLAWLPTYFDIEYGWSLAASSTASIFPWVAGAVVGNGAGWLADYLINAGISDTTTVRRVFQATALLVPAVCMALLSTGSGGSGAIGNLDASTAEELFTVAVAFGACSCVGFGSSVQDMKSKYTGIIYGLTSAVSVVTGSLGTYLTGVLLDQTHSWQAAFQTTAVVYVLGAIVYATQYKAQPRVET